jgi:hypothetical protein
MGALMAMRTLNGFGSHFDQTLGHRSFRAFKFINRHDDSFPERHLPLSFLPNNKITPPDILCQLEYFTGIKVRRPLAFSWPGTPSGARIA